MGKHRRSKARPGSLLGSLPDDVKAAFGIQEGAKGAKGLISGEEATRKKTRRESASFLSTQHEDEDYNMLGEGDHTLIQSDAEEELIVTEMEEDVLSDKASLGGRPVLDGLPISNTTALQKERSHLADILQQDHWELGHLTRKSVPATGATSVAASLGPDGFPISRKRRKLDNGAPYAGPLPRRYRQWDASALVPYYTQKMDMPPSLQKWFGRRHHLFSLYDKGCLMDEVGWFSVTPEKIADQIAERCRCDVVLDAFCGVGGNAIAFARTCDRVIAIDNSSIRLALARHNAALYGVADRIEFILADYPTFARSLIQLPSSSPSRRKIDVVFMSPPWGGPEYNKPAEGEEGIGEPATYKLAAISPVHGKELFELSRGITKNVAYYLPRHVDLEEVSALLDKEGGEMVEVEEEWMANRLTAVTCYFGGLAEGQGDMFDEPTA